jgi:hypothetical protein
MKATNLSRAIWNAMADLARRSQAPREIFFSEVVKADAISNLVWTKDFGDVAIPLVAFEYAFAYYDTQPTGNVTAGQPVKTKSVRREDVTHKNANFKTHVICPSVGDLVVILDVWGVRRFPVCIGLLQATGKAWEES